MIEIDWVLILGHISGWVMVVVDNMYGFSN